ncbi:hypothetical protein A11A3_14652 [Alcanivorax hongdengensis A-11-3]|uniref:Uncharacterized protein n=1 Tax=Alcanivorax hongdengensis A-11-3 TaxID=1177179 RepID=L0W953_9GAMM|nr:transporter [Alcanivorax hongdengensis]EKF73268.1 hypothetical protein A11A3_14652 [Alcanivorax hongdengensis A-11-3]
MTRWIALLLCLLAAPLWATTEFERPGLNMPTTTLDTGRFAWEQGLPDIRINTVAERKTVTAGFTTRLRAGLWKPLELQVASPLYLFQQTEDQGLKSYQDGAGDSQLALKAALYHGPVFRAALRTGATFDTGSDAFTRGDQGGLLTVSGDWRLDDRHRLSLTADYRALSASEKWLTLVPHWQAQLDDQLMIFLEAVYSHEQDSGRDDNRGGGGIAVRPWPDTQLDFYYRGGFDDESTDHETGLGLSVAF